MNNLVVNQIYRPRGMFKDKKYQNIRKHVVRGNAKHVLINRGSFPRWFDNVSKFLDGNRKMSKGSPY